MSLSRLQLWKLRCKWQRSRDEWERNGARITIVPTGDVTDVIHAIKEELLVGDTSHPEDAAYNRGLRDAICAVERLARFGREDA